MPGKYNPFRPDKILPPGSFVGRIPEIRMLDHCLTQTKHGNPQHFLLEGERGIGKSSLLRVQTFVAAGQIDIMDSKQRVSFITVSISLQEDDDYFAILRKIAEGLKREVAGRERLKSMALSAWDLISRIEGAGFRLRDAKASDQGELLATLQNDIAALIEHLGEDQDGLFLIIDEADRPPEAAGLGKICKLLTEELSRRNLDRLCIGLAGLPGLLNVLRGSHESSPRLFQTLSLQPLEPAECHAVVERALAEALKKNGFATTITPDAIKYVCDLSEGYPHFLQEFAYCAFEADTDNVIDLTDVTTSLFSENGAFDQLGRKYFDQFYTAPDSDDYRRVLDTMAEHSDDWISRASLITETGLKGGTVDNALRALKTKNIINQNELKSGLYKLPTKSFAIWIKARKRHVPDGGTPSLFPNG
ncbi:AAA family ATPase [Bradyrhizobium sp. 48]|uniref:AAA family ATPase n=1 Tax=Bradyrhizobium sp. 48 TaxID=2782676 RepID=UPI001FF87DA9|nr:ATP-binding protein [Bradyrhizobium sp. 48]MCK1447256.1 AAA family ATPase [Bradyrhizobium sp. 48]